MDRRSLLVGLAAASAWSPTPAAAVPNVRNSIVIIVLEGIDTSNSEKRVAVCTGFVISREGYVVTTGHAMRNLGAGIDPASITWKVFLSKYSADAYPAAVIQEYPWMDLIVLNARIRNTPVVPMRPWRGEPRIDEGVTPVYSAGYAQDEDYKVEEGRISSLSGSSTPGLQAWTTSQFGFKPGQSGSPVYTADGRVLAVVKASDRVNPSVGYVVPARIISSELWDHVYTPQAVARLEAAPTLTLFGDVPAGERSRSEVVDFRNSSCEGFQTLTKRVSATSGWRILDNTITLEPQFTSGQVRATVENRSEQSFDIFAALQNSGTCATLPGQTESVVDTPARFNGIVRYVEAPLEGTRETVVLGRSPLVDRLNLPISDLTATNLLLEIAAPNGDKVQLDEVPQAVRGRLGVAELNASQVLASFRAVEP